MELQTNCIINADCAEALKEIPNESIDMVLTSPPYDELRDYNGFIFDFKTIANELVRIIKPGGVIVWIVADGTKKGSETGTSFKQALCFMDAGMNLHDTMIWQKESFSFPENNRYPQTFDYMFIFSKGAPKTFNPIKDRLNIHGGTKITGTCRSKNGKTIPREDNGLKREYLEEYGVRFNVWRINTVKGSKEGQGHPAQFPEKLAIDHILSWSNVGDIVLDPFIGSGTTAVACIKTDRRYIGIEISAEYCKIANNRIRAENNFLYAFNE